MEEKRELSDAERKTDNRRINDFRTETSELSRKRSKQSMEEQVSKQFEKSTRKTRKSEHKKTVSSVSKVSNAAAYTHLKIGGEKFGADRVAGDVPDIVARFVESIIQDIGEIAAQITIKRKQKTIMKEDAETAIKRLQNYIKVGKMTID